jgi:XTP/dITP diphosphohydrolase
MSDVHATSWPALLIATTNTGKIREITEILTGLPIRLLTLADLPQAPAEPDETGSTFADNAALKARSYAYAAGLPTVAEDSGLAIDALGGRPGIHSARYPGETYADKFRNLLTELEPHPRPWTARFICSLAFVVPVDGGTGDDMPMRFACEHTVEGEITDAPRGTHGFGYDPLFFHPPFGTTLGEVESARKRLVSHRGAAFRQFRQWMESDR